MLNNRVAPFKTIADNHFNLSKCLCNHCSATSFITIKMIISIGDASDVSNDRLMAFTSSENCLGTWLGCYEMFSQLRFKLQINRSRRSKRTFLHVNGGAWLW